MKIIRSETTGFCMGVRRAVEIARNAAFEAKCDNNASSSCTCQKIYSLGPLIHNPRVLDELNDLGITVLDELPEDLTNISIIIRAHGIAPEIEKKIKEVVYKAVAAIILAEKAARGCLLGVFCLNTCRKGSYYQLFCKKI